MNLKLGFSKGLILIDFYVYHSFYTSVLLNFYEFSNGKLIFRIVLVEIDFDNHKNLSTINYLLPILLAIYIAGLFYGKGH